MIRFETWTSFPDAISKKIKPMRKAQKNVHQAAPCITLEIALRRRAEQGHLIPSPKGSAMNVIAMRRTLTDEEMLALKELFPAEKIEVFTTYPKSADEHLSDCERHAARFCFLPHEEPIPLPAMRRGFDHVLVKQGKLHRLVNVAAEFESLTH
jgi:hypothetical protein